MIRSQMGTTKCFGGAWGMKLCVKHNRMRHETPLNEWLGEGQLGQGHTAVVGDAPGELGDNLRPIDWGTVRCFLGHAVYFVLFLTHRIWTRASSWRTLSVGLNRHACWAPMARGASNAWAITVIFYFPHIGIWAFDTVGIRLWTAGNWGYSRSRWSIWWNGR